MKPIGNSNVPQLFAEFCAAHEIEILQNFQTIQQPNGLIAQWGGAVVQVPGPGSEI